MAQSQRKLRQQPSSWHLLLRRNLQFSRVFSPPAIHPCSRLCSPPVIYLPLSLYPPSSTATAQRVADVLMWSSPPMSLPSQTERSINRLVEAACKQWSSPRKIPQIILFLNNFQALGRCNHWNVCIDCLTMFLKMMICWTDSIRIRSVTFIGPFAFASKKLEIYLFMV